jgi:hypothetical protein
MYYIVIQFAGLPLLASNTCVLNIYNKVKAPLLWLFLSFIILGFPLPFSATSVVKDKLENSKGSSAYPFSSRSLGYRHSRSHQTTRHDVEIEYLASLEFTLGCGTQLAYKLTRLVLRDHRTTYRQ